MRGAKGAENCMARVMVADVKPALAHRGTEFIASTSQMCFLGGVLAHPIHLAMCTYRVRGHNFAIHPMIMCFHIETQGAGSGKEAVMPLVVQWSVQQAIKTPHSSRSHLIVPSCAVYPVTTQ